MDEKEKVKQSVPYVVYESEQARSERHIHRLVVALIIAIVVIFLSNMAWLKAWTMYDYVGEDTDTSISVDAEGGNANYIGNDGDITNGTNKSFDKTQEESADT